MQRLRAGEGGEEENGKTGEGGGQRRRKAVAAVNRNWQRHRRLALFSRVLDWGSGFVANVFLLGVGQDNGLNSLFFGF